jgi:hypothetical protein
LKVKDDPERDRFWDALRPLEEDAGTEREQTIDLRLVGEYFDSIRNYEDAAIISWELHHWQRLPVGASLVVFCGNPNCVNPSHMRMEVPKYISKVCSGDEKSVLSNGEGEKFGK